MKIPFRTLAIWTLLAFSGVAQAQFQEMFGGAPNAAGPGGMGLGGGAPSVGAGALGGGGPSVSVPSITNWPSSDPSAVAPDTSRRPLVVDPRERNEFQDFILQSTGKDLPMFGYDLFRNASTFAASDNSTAPSDYVVGPGDELQIRGWGQVVVDFRARVERDGTINIPQVGSILVAGTSYQELTRVVRAAFARNYRNFEMSVSLVRLRSVQIFVVGQARQPGTLTVSALSTLVNAVFAAGGPSSKGSMRRIQLKRGNKVITEFDFYDLLVSGDKSRDARLQAGDVIYIPPTGPLVAVSGSVNVPAIYELKDSVPLRDAIAWAGGLATTAQGQRVTVERIVDRRARTIDEFTLDADGMGKGLKDGDLVTVYAVAPRFDNAVTLRGNVTQPARFPWRQGMRVRDLIPDRDSLVTRDYWNRRNQNVGLTPDVNRILAQQQVVGTTLNVQDLQRRLQDDPSTTVAEDIRRRQIEAESTRLVEATTGVRQPVRGNQQPQQTPQTPQTGAPQAGIVGTQAQAQAQAVPGQATGLAGPARVAPIRPDPGLDPTRLVNQIRPNTREVNWDYAVVERINKADLSTSLIPFNLGKAVIDSDPQHNVVLEPGDVVTIFSREDLRASVSRQVKFVRLEGEIAAPGVYQALPGETLRQLVTRVGGFTSSAYVFGSEFTRESTRLQQERSLEESINRLEREIQQYNAIRPANLTAPEDAAGLRAQIEGQTVLLAKLRQLRPSGRIVLELPDDGRVRDLPDIALEDGDRLFVPSPPSMVNVFGSVYSEASFVYRPEKRVGDYLAQAGGPTRNADKSSIYVMRADGSVFSNRGSNRLFASLDSSRILPGDSIIVPEEYDKSTWARALRDWAQVFYQFGLGAAALKVLRN